jgi:hypothetical protein
MALNRHLPPKFNPLMIEEVPACKRDNRDRLNTLLMQNR